MNIIKSKTSNKCEIVAKRTFEITNNSGLILIDLINPELLMITLVELFVAFLKKLNMINPINK